jgi:hypothetical protein
MAGTKKKNRNKRRGGKASFKVRLKRDEAMELMRIGGEDMALAETHLRMIRPELSPAARKEVAMRCSDPQKHGGIETGRDHDGDYADILVLSATR